jgi:outer membrane scaffolding protein for murein synthesis (MipA/OmpV family)
LKKKGLALAAAVCCAVFRAEGARAGDAAFPADLPPSAWVVELGGYGILQPTWLGSKSYELSFRPIGELHQAGDWPWLSFPNDSTTYSLFATDDVRAGPAASFSLQSRLHGQDIDLRLGKADVTTQGGAFVEYYPLNTIRTRVEVLQGITGNTGLAANLSADYIWRPRPDWTLTFGPRAQIVNDEYASTYFSTQYALAHGSIYSPFHAEGGLLTSGAEFTGKYDWSGRVSTKFFLDYNQLIGDAADSPRVTSRGAAEQVIVGIGATYRFAIER